VAETAIPFNDLLARARTGDGAALDELARQYEPEIRIMARVLLGPALRPYLDSMDLVQSVHRSLLVGMRQGKYDFSGPDRLVALALTMIRRKAARQWRRHRCQQRPAGDTILPDPLATLAAADGDPARAAAVNDALRLLWATLDATERRVMELRLEGHSTAEVARQLNLDADVLRVRLSRLRQRLRARGMLDDWL
jgi:RNA polymerase sigma-70 factor (ECF subfamily)